MYSPKELWPHPFKSAFCQKFGYLPEEYSTQVFWRCLYLHALPVAALLYYFRPHFFKEDFDLIAEVGALNDPELFKSELNFFFGRNVREKNWFRRSLRIRVSGDKLIALKNRIYNNAALKASVIQQA